MKKLLIATLSLILLGCVSDIKYNYMPEVTQKSYPELNTITTTYIGDDMINQGKVKLMDAISFTTTTEITRPFHAYIIEPGDYPKLGENKTHLFFATKSENSNAIVKTFTSSPEPIGIRIRKDNAKNEVCISFSMGSDFCNDNIQYKVKKILVASRDEFQQTLIYNGKIGNKINIGYREFNNDLTHPAFSNNAEYDLSSSKVIRYKGAVIEILEATNQYIKYKVISNFNTPK
ncbi:hypothetical protein A9G13_10050 [Gilliamella sp. wkB178]|uniref:hypothetical protein n=1 Tax=Gilliamella sp. wkB178 TaxID=3120259 RepID=UPI00080DE877|nr:hypothetical protein [Gilliamella apicola]OCG06599.1 hypothetical protein A9G13_10050 [Gilliamella apicola]